jgi:hypothetical protein
MQQLQEGRPFYSFTVISPETVRSAPATFPWMIIWVGNHKREPRAEARRGATTWALSLPIMLVARCYRMRYQRVYPYYYYRHYRLQLRSILRLYLCLVLLSIARTEGMC